MRACGPPVVILRFVFGSVREGGRKGGRSRSPLCCDDQAIQLGREMKRRSGLRWVVAAVGLGTAFP